MDLLRRLPLPMGDQDALNTLVNGAWTRVEPKFNAQNAIFYPLDRGLMWVAERRSSIEEAFEDPAVVHFHAGRPRPWQQNCEHPRRSDWTDTLRETVWSDWALPRRSKMAEWAAAFRRRAGRAIRELRGPQPPQ